MVFAMNDPHLTTAHPVELLAITTSRVSDEAKVILTLRLKSGSFEASNVAFSPQQARRLLDDLTERFESSKLLHGFSSTDDEGRDAYERIMFDGPTSETPAERTGGSIEDSPEEPTQ